MKQLTGFFTIVKLIVKWSAIVAAGIVAIQTFQDECKKSGLMLDDENDAKG
jgi:hypothetical protein